MKVKVTRMQVKQLIKLIIKYYQLIHKNKNLNRNQNF